jgi:hypothetical protein
VAFDETRIHEEWYTAAWHVNTSKCFHSVDQCQCENKIADRLKVCLTSNMFW